MTSSLPTAHCPLPTDSSLPTAHCPLPTDSSLPTADCRLPTLIQLTTDPISYEALTESVRSPLAGAVVLFLGTVREMTEGRRTVSLEYEAHAEMAVAQMQKLETEARATWPLIGVRIAHRLGRLGLGEVSVAVAVSAAHRQAAFEAGRFLIDRLKECVPIWKKEEWADGSSAWIHPGVG